jgi:hypothetical protein
MSAFWAAARNTSAPSAKAPDLDALGTPLPLRLALDLATSELAVVGDEHPTIVIAATPGAAAEAAARIHKATIVRERPTAGSDGRTSRPVSSPWEIVEADSRGVPLRLASRSFAAALWIWPQRRSWRHWVKELDRVVQHGGPVAIVGSGPLDRLRSQLRPHSALTSSSAADPFTAGAELGYSVEATWRLCGVRSTTWATLRIAAERAARPDLADRCEAAYQLGLVEARAPRLWSVGVWVGRK